MLFKEAQKARNEDIKFNEWLRRRGEEVLKQLKEEGKIGIVLAGHPYHIDPAINHDLPDEIIRLDMAVLTEDAISHLAPSKSRDEVVNQWTFHSRLYEAAEVVKEHPNLELLHITSFGCGLDAITTDAVQEILENGNQLYTWIKVDEISNLGAARIRLRSMKAAIEERKNNHITGAAKKEWREQQEAVYDKKAKKIYTILAPQMVPTHFKLFEEAFNLHGYRLKVLEEVEEKDIEEGLRYVNNDACYPAIVTIGQLIDNLKKGDYDLNRTAVIMPQTGGGCRATNYFALLQKALKNAGMGQVPVLSLSAKSISGKKHTGFRINFPLAKKLVIAANLGDLLLRLKLAVRPYETVKGAAEAVYRKWLEKSKYILSNFTMKEYKKLIQEIIDDFNNIGVTDEKKPKVGVVGEILVKFHPYANNQVVKLIEEEGGEAVVPDFIDFFLYGLYNRNYKSEHFGFSKWDSIAGNISIEFIEYYRKPVRKALQESGRFSASLEISEIAEKASKFLSLGNQMGEGWLLSGEIAELMDAGVQNVVCVQPFGCLPNHIVGKGMFNAIKKSYPNANFVAIDYDASISKVNQVNRIKLMMSVARSNMA